MRLGLMLLFITAFGADAMAEDETGPKRRFGYCSKAGSFCFGPSATISLASYDFNAERTKLGFIPGIGYGVNFWADQPYTVGAAIYLAVSGESDRPTVVTPSVIFSFAEYVRIGFGFSHVDATDMAESSTAKLLLFGFGVDFGTTPTSKKTEQLFD